jgi:hypothetical protein
LPQAQDAPKKPRRKPAKRKAQPLSVTINKGRPKKPRRKIRTPVVRSGRPSVSPVLGAPAFGIVKALLALDEPTRNLVIAVVRGLA